MGCRMAISRRDPDDDTKTTSKTMNREDSETTEGTECIPVTTLNDNSDLLCLPNEVLVKIMSFLNMRDRLKLRCVSQKLRSISEAPLFWREFVWPDCNSREERWLHYVMKSWGVHVRQLSFPQCLTQAQRVVFTNPPKLIEPPPLSFPQNSLYDTNMDEPLPLQIIRKQKPPLTLRLVNMSEMAKILQYCSNLTHLNLPGLSFCRDESDELLKEAIREMRHLEVLKIHCPWHRSLRQYLNLNVPLQELTIYIMKLSKENMEASKTWMENGFIPPKLNIVSMQGSFLRFREFLSYTWYRWNYQVPTGHSACLKVYDDFYKAPLNLFEIPPMFQLQYGKGTLPFGYVRSSNVTELDLGRDDYHLKQIAGVYPRLQRLNLQHSLCRLEDLQVIAACCCNLQGLNLFGIWKQDIYFCLQLWEILSGMKLTHLSILASFVEKLTDMDDVQEKQLVALFKQYTTLQALELATGRDSYKLQLLSHFPSLRCCTLVDNGWQSTCMQEILTTCKNLRCFYYVGSIKLPPLLVQNNLQQLCLSSRSVHLDDNFMKTVSAHGGLIHVGFSVGSVTSKGVVTLIENSPNLLSFILYENTLNESLNDLLRRKFNHRNLFISGVFMYTKVSVRAERIWLRHTDLSTLWPKRPDYFSPLKLDALYH